MDSALSQKQSDARTGAAKDDGPPKRAVVRHPGVPASKVSYFCFQPPPLWYHQPLRALSIHCVANTSRIRGSHSG